MRYNIEFTPEAEDTFDALTEQLANRWGLEYVYQFEDRVIKALNIISDTPLLYPVIVESSQIRKCVLHNKSNLKVNAKSSNPPPIDAIPPQFFSVAAS